MRSSSDSRPGFSPATTHADVLADVDRDEAEADVKAGPKKGDLEHEEERANVVDPEQDVVADLLDGGKSVQEQRHRIDRDDRLHRQHFQRARS